MSFHKYIGSRSVPTTSYQEELISPLIAATAEKRTRWRLRGSSVEEMYSDSISPVTLRI